MKRIPIQLKSGPGEGMETKQVQAQLEVKAEGEGGILHIKAYALAFGNIDSWGDIIMPSACDEFLKSADADRMALCWQHDRTTVIGIVTAKGVDDYGMWIEADILPTTAGNDAAILLRSGAVKEFSIGYRADKYHYEKRDGYEYDIRILDAITVYEVSPVTIAANPAAVIVSAKADPEHNNNPNPKNLNIMTPDEIKAMQESIEKAATEKVTAELKAKIEEIQAKQETIDAQEKSIDNLDKTIKAQQATIDDLKKRMEEKARVTFMGAFKAAIEEKKDAIEALLKSNSGSMKLSFDWEKKTDYDITVAGDITRIGWGSALDARIASAPIPANAFYESFAKEQVNALFFNWLEGTYTDQTGYVDELAQMADGNAAAEEKTRKMAKCGAHLLLSSEVTDFFTALYDWARNQAQAKILAFADGEIFAGLGADTNDTTKKKVYGVKSQATAFSGLGTYNDATIADVMLDAEIQAKKEGYNLDKAFVSFADYADIRGLKNNNGNYLYNEVTGMLGALQIVPTAQVSSDTMLLADSSVVKIKERPTYELEIVRNAKLDGWDVYLRKSLQVLVKTPDKKGLIWVSSIASAITAINQAGPASGIVSNLNSIKTSASTIATNSANIKDNSTAIAGINTAATKLAGAVNESNQVETHANS